MKFFDLIQSCLTALIHKPKLDADMNAEMRAHIEMRTQQKTEAGMNPEDARIAALRQFGWAESIKEDCRAQRGTAWFENLGQDIRFGIRQLGKNRGFTATAALTLALGIGANIAIFSVVNAVMLRPLPYPDSDRLVEVKGPLSIPNFYDWQQQQSVFEQICLYRAFNFNVITDQGEPTQVMGVQLSASVFAALRLNPVAGRFFSAEEDKTGAPHVTVLSEAYWRSKFNSDSNVVGRTVSIDGTRYTVVGVMPSAFELVSNAGLVVPVEPAIEPSDRNNRKNQPSFEAVARLKPGVSLDHARIEMETISRRLAGLYPEVNKDSPIALKPLIEARIGDARQTMWILIGAVLLVLLIACANVANLLMVRATIRRKEMALRTALGANLWRILRQMLTESILLTALGAAIGLILAQGSMPLIRALAQNTLPRALEIGIDSRVLLFSTAAALIVGVLIGLVSGWKAAMSKLSDTLKDAGRSSSSGRTPLLNGLLIGQVALSLVLLSGAGLLLRSFHRLSQVKAGFNHEQVVSFRLDLPAEKYQSPGLIDQFSKDLLSRLGNVPGVRSVSLATEVPMSGRSWVTDLLVEGREEPDQHPLMRVNVVGADYFRVMGIPILKGRPFADSDSPSNWIENGANKPNWSHLRSIIIDEEFARRQFGNEDPIGKQIRLPWGTTRAANPVMTVVGVAGRVKLEKLREQSTDVLPMGYLAYGERPNRHIVILAKTALPSETLARAAREQLTAIDSTLPIYELQTLAQMRDANIAPERLNLMLLGSAALIALALAVIGMYGVVAFSVAQRQREIGVRMALGAQRKDVLVLVVIQFMRLILIGTAVGLIGAFGFSHALANLLFEVRANDLSTFAIVPGILIAAAALACALPARRATKVDPMMALRAD